MFIQGLIICLLPTLAGMQPAAVPPAATYRDGRPAAKQRLNAQDHGVVLRHGDGTGRCDALGARDVWVFEADGTCCMHYDVVTRCIERGINHIDACCEPEVIAYSKALKGRRDKMHLHFSHCGKEIRNPEYRTSAKLKEAFEDLMKRAGLEYVDIYRITCHEDSSRHTDAEMEEAMKTLDWAKKSGRARFTGISSHERPHIKKWIKKCPDQLEVIVTPYTARSKLLEGASGLWAAMKKLDVGWFGIKPFATNSVFKGDSSPDSPYHEEDNRIARLAIRYILCNPAITAPIPGLISVEQVDNVALAVMERRELDLKEKAELDAAMDRAWANLPSHYQWLKDWDYV